jgi:Zn-dependent protease
VNRDTEPKNRIARLLAASWPLFPTFGSEVRVHWSVVAVPFAIFGVLVKLFAAQHLVRPLEPANTPVDAAVWALAWTAGLYLTVWLHEIGHVLTARRFGVAPRPIVLALHGGVGHAESPMPSPAAEIWTALAGPATQLAFAAVLAVPVIAFRLYEHELYSRTLWVQMYLWFAAYQVALGVLNMLPWCPFDGSRVLHGEFLRRMTPRRAGLWTAWVGYGGAVAMMALGAGIAFDAPPGENLLLFAGVFVIVLGVNGFLTCRRIQLAAQHAEVPAEPAETWKKGRPDEVWRDSLAESERLSRAEERRERREAEARRHEEEERHRVQERIDQLLDRINEVGGVENLSVAERRELDEASELLRREAAGN